jgi:3-hydroxyisobutyrate dehydrogenase
VNNTLVALADRLGLPTETVIDAVGGGPLVSAWQAAKLARIAKGEFSAQFALSLALKDVRLALQAAEGAGWLPSGAWPRSGSRPSMPGLAART